MLHGFAFKTLVGFEDGGCQLTRWHREPAKGAEILVSCGNGVTHLHLVFFLPAPKDTNMTSVEHPPGLSFPNCGRVVGI